MRAEEKLKGLTTVSICDMTGKFATRPPAPWARENDKIHSVRNAWTTTAPLAVPPNRES